MVIDSDRGAFPVTCCDVVAPRKISTRCSWVLKPFGSNKTLFVSLARELCIRRSALWAAQQKWHVSRTSLQLDWSQLVMGSDIADKIHTARFEAHRVCRLHSSHYGTAVIDLRLATLKNRPDTVLRLGSACFLTSHLRRDRAWTKNGTKTFSCDYGLSLASIFRVRLWRASSAHEVTHVKPKSIL